MAIAGTVYLHRLWQANSLKASRSGTHHDDDDQVEQDEAAARAAWYPDEVAEEEQREEEIPNHLKREIYKEQRRQEKIPLLAMKKPMYDNICMLDPQGELLSTISKKKARWYIKKELGVWKDEEKTTLQLLFEPSHRSNQSQPKADDEDKENKEYEQEQFFNKSIKDNVCVVCGKGDYFMRHYIVPYACRSLLPDKFKMHMAHDVVILCPDCQLECKKWSTERVKFLENQYRVDPKTAIEHFTNKQLYKVRSKSLALLKFRAKLPADNIAEYEAKVRKHFQLSPEEELTEEILKKGTQINYDIPNPKFIPPSKIIVDAMCTNDEETRAFVRAWRKHFLDTMEPQYLPTGWSVDSPVECKKPERKGFDSNTTEDDPTVVHRNKGPEPKAVVAASE